MPYDMIWTDQNVFIEKKREMAAIIVEMHVSSIASLSYCKFGTFCEGFIFAKLRM